VISIQGLHKTFSRAEDEDIKVLQGINLSVEQGEFVGLIGYSGCGKTTLLRIVCGFETANEGLLLLDGKKHETPSRDMLMLFQDFNQLFPWKTVLGNVVHPLISTGFMKDRKEAKSRAMKRIADVGLSGFEKYYPHELSGGMKQRVGIARAYCTNPEILLMDEPFGALDAQTRYQMEEEILRIWEKEKRTVIFITNNIEEALYLGDRIILLSCCPARVKEVYVPGFARPRDNLDPKFLALRETIEANTDLAL